VPFTVVLDTCVIYPAHLRDTLLRQAERGLYRALWSADILDELHRNLVEDGFNANSVDQLDLAPSVVIEELRQQAAANKREPKTPSGLLDTLARAGAPSFADEVRRRVT
jgi:hypothetical protein